MEPSPTAHPPSPSEQAVPEKTFGKGTSIGRVKVGVALRIVSSQPRMAITLKRNTSSWARKGSRMNSLYETLDTERWYSRILN